MTRKKIGLLAVPNGLWRVENAQEAWKAFERR